MSVLGAIVCRVSGVDSTVALRLWGETFKAEFATLPSKGGGHRRVLGGMLYLFMKKLLALGASILLLVGLESCSAEQRELNRHSSPNQKLVAVLMESMRGGAAGSVYEDIYVSDQGVPLNLDNPIFGAVGCDRLTFDWANDYTLEIHYESTCAIRQFTNRWFRPSDLAAGRPVPVEIILIRN